MPLDVARGALTRHTLVDFRRDLQPGLGQDGAGEDAQVLEI